MFSSVLLIQNCLGAVGRLCDIGHRKRMWRRRQNILNTNVKKKGSPVDERERRKRGKGDQSEKTGFELCVMENWSSSQRLPREEATPHKKNVCLEKMEGQDRQAGKDFSGQEWQGRSRACRTTLTTAVGASWPSLWCKDTIPVCSSPTRWYETVEDPEPPK